MPLLDTSELGAVIAVLAAFVILAWHISKPMRDGKGSESVCKTSEASNSSKKPASATFQAIPDRYGTIAGVRKALRKAGLESSGLIIAVDFTKSNAWSGEVSFEGKCLHTLDPAVQNPYQRVISSFTRTLHDLDEENEIPAYGFGDIRTKDHSVFPFNEGGAPCTSLDHVLDRYSELAGTVRMSGPTSFAPAIRESLRVIQAKGGYHVLLIIADGQVTDEQETTEAIVAASHFPLSIVVVGVGDGPWEMMEEFDDQLPERQFDNFQFVPYEHIRSLCAAEPPEAFDAMLATACLQELPDQYQELRRQGKLRRKPSVTAGAAPAEPTTRSATRQDTDDADCKKSAKAQDGDFAGAFPDVPGSSSNTTAPQAAPREPPDNYLCPITTEVMVDPVVAEDGYTYERVSIERWFTQRKSRNDTAPSPMGNHPIGIRLIPNNALRSEIMEWQERNMEVID